MHYDAQHQNDIWPRLASGREAYSLIACASEENWPHQLEYDAGDIAVVYPRNVFDVDSFGIADGVQSLTVSFSLEIVWRGALQTFDVISNPMYSTAGACYLDVLWHSPSICS